LSVGSLPNEIDKLQHLSVLRLSDNYLSGTIPRTINNITTLAILSIPYNYFTGGFPELGSLHDLSILDFDYNRELSGTLTASLFQNSNLVLFSSYSTGLHGTLPDFGNMTSLVTFLVDRNDLTGTVPASLTTTTSLMSVSFAQNSFHGPLPVDFSQMVNLRRFLFDSNYLTGPIPSSLMALTSLREFIVYDNSLTGHIADVFTTDHQLSDFYVDVNRLSGPLPESFTNLRKAQYISIMTNHLSGSIPSNIGLMDIYSLFLSDNYLTGPLPTSLFEMTNLDTLQLSKNKLSGTISSEIAKMSSLKYLHLSQNRFRGNIPAELGFVTTLSQLQLFFNNFVGTIPSEIAKLTVLDNLILADNFLTGTIPNVLLTNLTNLVTFSVQSNLLEGEIPPALWDMDWIYYVYISDNRLSGSIPSSISNMSSVYFLHIGKNLLTGSIPDEISSMTKLLDLNFEGNYLTGLLPKYLFTNVSSLSYVYFGSNDLTGPIPDINRDFCIFSMFDVSNNMLTGSLPEGLFTCIVPYQLRNVVIYAYFQQNQFSGTIPESIGIMHNVKQLFFSENYLTGTIPVNISQCRNLQTLLLQNNLLTGLIDDVLTPSTSNDTLVLFDDDHMPAPKFFSLQTVDLSSNRFNGPVPSLLFLLPNIVYVSMLSNCFTGSIPSTICESDSLQFAILEGLRSGKECQTASTDVFGISNAYYTAGIEGTIPECIWKLTNLQTLHLSGNRLKGTIPSSANLLFVTDLSLSYNALSGTIPTSIQSENYLQLDLSHNRFSGNFKSSESTETMYNDQSIKLSANRFSGKFPQQFLNVKDVDVLVGNIFECSSTEDIPKHDPEHKTYVCGSDDYDVPLLMFVIGIGVLGVLCGAGFYLHFVYHRMDDENQVPVTAAAFSSLRKIIDIVALWISHLQQQQQGDSLPSSLRSFLYTLTDIRSLTIRLALLIGVVYSLFYAIGKPSDLMGWGTHYHQYRWYISGAYLHGLGCSVVLLLLLLLLNGTVIAFFDRRHAKLLVVMEHTHDGSHKDRSLSDLNCSEEPYTRQSGASSATGNTSQGTWTGTLRAYGFVFAVLFSNGVIVLVVKGAFVYFLIMDELSFTAQILLQLALSAFDLGWNAVVMRRVVSLYPNVLRSKIRVRLHLSLLVFNSIIAPMLSQSVVDRNCFSELFSKKDDITTTSSFLFCERLVGSGCEAYNSIELSTSYLPPFTYMYQCSSSLITNFVPVMLFSHLFLGLVFPCLLLIHCATADYLQLDNSHMPMLPPIFRPQDIQSSSLFSQDSTSQQKHLSPQKTQFKLLTPELIISSTLHHVIVMGTFGWTSPPLAIAIAWTITAWTFIWPLGISRFLIYAGSEREARHAIIGTATQAAGTGVSNAIMLSLNSPSADAPSASSISTDVPSADDSLVKTQHILSLECAGVWQGPFKSMWVITDTSAVFSGFMLMDIAGDEVGWFRALAYVVIPLIVVVVFGLRLYFKGDIFKVLTWKAPITTSSSNDVQDNGKEGEDTTYTESAIDEETGVASVEMYISVAGPNKSPVGRDDAVQNPMSS
jgi:Leucine-rich repeat (LRR) protein